MHPKHGNYVEFDPSDFDAKFLRQVAYAVEVPRGAVREMAEYGKELFKLTVSTWDEEPEFVIVYEKDGDVAHVGTNNPVYYWVHEGTGPRDIVPRSPGGVLVFRSTYKPRTTPYKLASGRKWRGGNLVFTKRVKGHKIKPRKFAVTIVKQIEQRAGNRLLWHARKFLERFKEIGV